MRAPGEASGMMALEIAMDELAAKLGMDPVELRVRNDTQVDPEKPTRLFSQRNLVRCPRDGAERFGWQRRCATGWSELKFAHDGSEREFKNSNGSEGCVCTRFLAFCERQASDPCRYT